MKTQKLPIALILGLGMLLGSCGEKTKKNETVIAPVEEMAKEPVYNTEDPASILASVAYAHGGWKDLLKKGDVAYTYDYRYPANNDADVSTERYIFKSEVSFGHYEQHQINVMPKTPGKVSQFFNGTETTVKHNDAKVEDPQILGGADFLRRANYFWFVMPYKLGDKGTIVSYLGQEEYNSKVYDKVKVTYDPEITGKEQNDTYILYVNPTTRLIDRFYFSLPFLGLNDPLIIANYFYETIEGQTVATKRTYFMPKEDGTYGEEPSLVQTISDLSFNNGFTTTSIVEMN